MSVEKQQKQSLPNKTYQYIGLITITGRDAFEEFRNRLKRRSDQVFTHQENTLFLLEIVNPETGSTDYHSYDYFQNIDSFEQLNQLRKIADKDIEALNLQKNVQIPLTDPEQKKLIHFTNRYGYPPNYRSNMYLGRNYGWHIGAVIGIALGIAFVTTFFITMSPVLAPAMAALVSSLLVFGAILFVGMCILGSGGTILITEVTCGGLGAIIGTSIGALTHYYEKTFVEYKTQNQQEDQISLENENDSKLQTPSLIQPDQSQHNISGEIFSRPLFAKDISPANDELSCKIFFEVLLEDTLFTSKPK